MGLGHCLWTVTYQAHFTQAPRCSPAGWKPVAGAGAGAGDCVSLRGENSFISYHGVCSNEAPAISSFSRRSWRFFPVFSSIKIGSCRVLSLDVSGENEDSFLWGAPEDEVAIWNRKARWWTKDISFLVRIGVSVGRVQICLHCSFCFCQHFDSSEQATSPSIVLFGNDDLG